MRKNKSKSLLNTRDDLFIEKIIRAYQVHKSCRKIAAIFHISYKTIARYLHEANVPMNPVGGTIFKGKPKTEYHTSCLARWLRDNPGVKLPKSPKKISEITGCSPDAIKCYLYRRRKRKCEK